MANYYYRGEKKTDGKLTRYCIECDEPMTNPHIDEDTKKCTNKECPFYDKEVTNWSIIEEYK